jgi:hypothetical protein
MATIATIADPIAEVLVQGLQNIFSKKADSVTDAEGQVQEVAVSVTGVVSHAQFVSLLALTEATDTHLSAKRSGAGQRYFLTASNAK